VEGFRAFKMDRSAIMSRMGRRMGIAFACCAVLPVLLFAILVPHDLHELSPTHVAVLDARGSVLRCDMSVPAETVRMFQQAVASIRDRGDIRQALAWQSDGEAWHGLLTQLPLHIDASAGAPWAIASFNREPALWAQ